MLRNSRRITISIEERNEGRVTSTKERVVVVDGRWKRPRFHSSSTRLPLEKKEKKGRKERERVVPVARRDKKQRERAEKDIMGRTKSY